MRVRAGRGSLTSLGYDGSRRRVVDHLDPVEVDRTVMTTERHRPSPEPQLKSTTRWLYLVAVTGCAILAPLLLLKGEMEAGGGLLVLLLASLGGLVVASEDR